MGSATFTTKQIAGLNQVHPNTVRLYEEWGFIARAERRENNYRIFNEDHLWQMKLARIALPGPYPINGQIVQQLVKAFARQDLSAALSLAGAYKMRVEAEKERGLQGLKILDQWFEDKTGDPDRIMVCGRKMAAGELDVSLDALRTWERNGLFAIQKDDQGRLRFSEWDMEKIRVIRLLRNCGYSISSLLRVFGDETSLREKPSVLLSLPDQNADFYYTTDLFIEYLEQHLTRADAVIALIKEYQHNK